ncbi:hypothetical protein ACJMK2_036689 [Sinanodonta woodiana]|uniref:Uncharacterized protein n=1 Tax=Sinanodonta woodiana TaxID=1069815 RepID=A0ABD3WLG5_SINWO
MVIPLRNYHRCCSGVPSTVVTRSMARKLVSEMQIQDLTVGDETLVDVAPLSDLPDPLSESSVSFGMPADLEGTFIGKEKVCLEPLRRSIFQAIDLVSMNACVVFVFLLCFVMSYFVFVMFFLRVNACVVFVFILCVFVFSFCFVMSYFVYFVFVLCILNLFHAISIYFICSMHFVFVFIASVCIRCSCHVRFFTVIVLAMCTVFVLGHVLCSFSLSYFCAFCISSIHLDSIHLVYVVFVL